MKKRRKRGAADVWVTKTDAGSSVELKPGDGRRVTVDLRPKPAERSGSPFYSLGRITVTPPEEDEPR